MRLSRDQVRQVDRLAIERYHIPGIVLMENAARAVADVACSMLGKTVLILAGGGNNGGDGLAAARHLANRGMQVRIALTIDPARYSGDALINWKIAQAMGLPALPADPTDIAAATDDLIIDAIFGTGLSQSPREPFSQIADAVARSGRPVLAIDLPSGLDCDTGQLLGPCIRASKTITFVAEKIGFANAVATQFLGEIIIGDIGCPRQAIDDVLRQPSL